MTRFTKLPYLYWLVKKKVILSVEKKLKTILQLLCTRLEITTFSLSSQTAHQESGLVKQAKTISLPVSTVHCQGDRKQKKSSSTKNFNVRQHSTRVVL